MSKLVFFVCLVFSLSLTHALRLGVENIPADFVDQITALVKNNRVAAAQNRPIGFALIANHTSKTSKAERTVDILLDKKVPIVAIIAPEHGFSGSVQAGQTVNDSIDAKTKLPIFSAYVAGSGKNVKKELVESIDGFIFDIQDAGMRHYTYISTLISMMKSAQEQGKIFIVLDRPNLLGGMIEGPALSTYVVEKKSFIAAAQIPLRYGITVAELARYFNSYILKIPVPLCIVPMANYNRDACLFPAHFFKLSPNICNKDACYGYSFLGLLGEVRPFDVGIGTKDSFALIGVPQEYDIKLCEWKKLITIFKSASITANYHTYFNEKKKKSYHGVRLKISAIGATASFPLLLSVLMFFKQQGVPLLFSALFDDAIGTDSIRCYLDGAIERKSIAKIINKQNQLFIKKVEKLLLYKQYPCVSFFN